MMKSHRFTHFALPLWLVICFGFLLSGFPLVLDLFQGWLPQAVTDAISSLSFMTHFSALSRGVVDLRAVVYFALVIGFWLLANAIILELRKAD